MSTQTSTTKKRNRNQLGEASSDLANNISSPPKKKQKKCQSLTANVDQNNNDNPTNQLDSNEPESTENTTNTVEPTMNDFSENTNINIDKMNEEELNESLSDYSDASTPHSISKYENTKTNIYQDMNNNYNPTPETYLTKTDSNQCTENTKGLDNQSLFNIIRINQSTYFIKNENNGYNYDKPAQKTIATKQKQITITPNYNYKIIAIFLCLSVLLLIFSLSLTYFALNDTVELEIPSKIYTDHIKSIDYVTVTQNEEQPYCYYIDIDFFLLNNTSSGYTDGNTNVDIDHNILKHPSNNIDIKQMDLNDIGTITNTDYNLAENHSDNICRSRVTEFNWISKIYKLPNGNIKSNNIVNEIHEITFNPFILMKAGIIAWHESNKRYYGIKYGYIKELKKYKNINIASFATSDDLLPDDCIEFESHENWIELELSDIIQPTIFRYIHIKKETIHSAYWVESPKLFRIFGRKKGQRNWMPNIIRTEDEVMRIDQSEISLKLDFGGKGIELIRIEWLPNPNAKITKIFRMNINGFK